MAEQELATTVKYVQAEELVRSDVAATSRPLFTPEELEQLQSGVDPRERSSAAR
jgi:hypothetical protein